MTYCQVFHFLQGNPNAFLVNSVIQSEKESAAKFTIFAPNDAAFAATFPGGIDDGDVFFDVRNFYLPKVKNWKLM